MNGGGENVRSLFIEGVVDAIDPLHVGTEARAPLEIEREVGAETAGDRDRIDEVPERRRAGEHEVVAAGVVAGRDARLRDARDRASDRLGAPAARVPPPGPADRGGAVPADRQLPA